MAKAATFHVYKAGNFADLHGASSHTVKVKDPNSTFDHASQEDVVRHVLGRDSKGSGNYMNHGTIHMTQDGEGGVHEGYHEYEGKRTHFRIEDRG